VFPVRYELDAYILLRWNVNLYTHPCGGGFEYLHRDPASRRRRRKGKSQN
jgi:hypothetical protein